MQIKTTDRNNKIMREKINRGEIINNKGRKKIESQIDRKISKSFTF